ncbi:hypothetical protein QQS21_004988 [Conoideocrella luteorostrata]|uniref:Uncharacterized protein n=1 Tax=Conoideocrella luteorostrata TaxID=1105319 RepID=A0AAJ0FUX6_9HYPO|nr:hypothetical protein QQS21_004988 [Conoideocrella luteorostrata]
MWFPFSNNRLPGWVVMRLGIKKEQGTERSETDQRLALFERSPDAKGKDESELYFDYATMAENTNGQACKCRREKSQPENHLGSYKGINQAGAKQKGSVDIGE